VPEELSSFRIFEGVNGGLIRILPPAVGSYHCLGIITVSWNSTYRFRSNSELVMARPHRTTQALFKGRVRSMPVLLVLLTIVLTG
jgi:hypothetical protein